MKREDRQFNSIQSLALAKGICFKTTNGGASTGGHQYVDNSGTLLVSIEKDKSPKPFLPQQFITLSAWRYDDSTPEAFEMIVSMQDVFTSEFLKMPLEDAMKWIAQDHKRQFIEMIENADKFGSSALRTFWTKADKVD
jgi:hypothetical protein